LSLPWYHLIIRILYVGAIGAAGAGAGAGAAPIAGIPGIPGIIGIPAGAIIDRSGAAAAIDVTIMLSWLAPVVRAVASPVAICVFSIPSCEVPCVIISFIGSGILIASWSESLDSFSHAFSRFYRRLYYLQHTVNHIADAALCSIKYLIGFWWQEIFDVWHCSISLVVVCNI
jgi:hypothetical protein